MEIVNKYMSVNNLAVDVFFGPSGDPFPSHFVKKRRTRLHFGAESRACPGASAGWGVDFFFWPPGLSKRGSPKTSLIPCPVI